MKKFEDERINKVELKSNKFGNPIPVVFITPKQENKNTCVFIFVGGLGATNSFNVYMNNPLFDSNYFITYDKMAHGDNKNKASQFKRKFITELDEVVEWCTMQFNKKVFLLGESWGCAINFLYQKKYSNKIAGVINWNMPVKPIDPEKKTFRQMYSIAWRHIVTFLFNITCHTPPVQTSHSPLSRNQLLLRLRTMAAQATSNTKLTLSVWRFMRPSKKFLLSNSNNPNFNFLYVQSGQDALADWKVINKLEQKADSKHYYKMQTGYHILSFEPEESKDLFELIGKFIQR